MGYEWKTEGKNYIVRLQRFSKLRKKIIIKLYLMRLILPLQYVPFTLQYVPFTLQYVPFTLQYRTAIGIL